MKLLRIRLPVTGKSLIGRYNQENLMVTRGAFIAACILNGSSFSI